MYIYIIYICAIYSLCPPSKHHPQFTVFYVDFTVFPCLTVATALSQAPGAWNGIRVHLVRREVGTTAIAQASCGRQVRVQRAGQMDTSCYMLRFTCCFWEGRVMMLGLMLLMLVLLLLFLVVSTILSQSKKLIYHSTYMGIYIYIYTYIFFETTLSWRKPIAISCQKRSCQTN